MIHLKVLRNDANGEEAFYGFSDSPSNLLLQASPLQVLPTLNSHKTLQRNHYTLRLPPAVTHLLRVTPPKIYNPYQSNPYHTYCNRSQIQTPPL
ncbi:unnamed protein product [Cochlearia groenlandica]